jgi:hypothetical protein
VERRQRLPRAGLRLERSLRWGPRVASDRGEAKTLWCAVETRKLSRREMMAVVRLHTRRHFGHIMRTEAR